jgi:hypothetical protein
MTSANRNNSVLTLEIMPTCAEYGLETWIARKNVFVNWPSNFRLFMLSKPKKLTRISVLALCAEYELET